MTTSTTILPHNDGSDSSHNSEIHDVVQNENPHDLLIEQERDIEEAPQPQPQSDDTKYGLEEQHNEHDSISIGDGPDRTDRTGRSDSSSIHQNITNIGKNPGTTIIGGTAGGSIGGGVGNSKNGTNTVKNPNTFVGGSVVPSIGGIVSSGTGNKEKYPKDCYSFLSLYGPIRNPIFFGFGLMVFMFQMAFLALMIASVVHPSWSTNGDVDNPGVTFLAGIINSNSSPLVRATQIIAIVSYVVFSDASLQDVVKAVETFPRFDQATSRDRIGCMVFSCTLRFTQGFLAIIVALILVITSSNVIDIILNFTAINFISQLDNAAFYLAKWGKYGPRLEAEARSIEQLHLPRCMYRKRKYVRHQFTVCLFALILSSAIGAIIYTQERGDKWITRTLRIELQDGTDLEEFSGCYEIDENALGRREGKKRKVYKSIGENSGDALFGYCIEERQWMLFKSGSTKNACLAGDRELAHSSKTDSFDISTSFDETWFSASNTPLDLYILQLGKDVESQCSLFDNGKCDKVFNEIDYQFDGGDCCSATCTQSSCGLGTLTNAFDTANITGDGYQNCVDPNMKPITIRLDTFSSSRNPAIFNVSDSQVESYFDEYGIDFWSEDPVVSHLTVDCNERNVLSIDIDESMTNKSETVWIEDGADCIVTAKNASNKDTTSILYWANNPIWHVNYTVFHEENNTIEIIQANSGTQESSSFYRIPVCYFNKLSTYMNTTDIYDDNGHSTEALKWMSDDSTENSNCQDPFFIERYALSVLDFAAPITMNRTESMWINTELQCRWPTITCDGGGSVTELDLGASQLSGTIATSIGLLTSLNYLDFYANDLSGPIPSEIGLLTNMDSLKLDGNYLSGSIPSEICLLTNLTELWLYNNVISGTIPSEIGLLTSLTSLELYNNYLSGTIPSEIGLLTSLTSLQLYDNALTGSIPSEIGLLTNLGHLWLNNNYLSGPIPSEIGLLTSLTQLNLNNNYISGTIPSEIGTMASLTKMYWRLNYLSGSIPSEIGLLTNIEDLLLNDNALTGSIPSEIGFLTSLNWLNMFNNYLSGPIPSEIGMLIPLTQFEFHNNDLSGPVPSEIGLLTNVTWIDLANNKLTGSIPSELSALTSMKYGMAFYNNSFDDDYLPSSLVDIVFEPCIICDGNDGTYNIVGSAEDGCSEEIDAVTSLNHIDTYETIGNCKALEERCAVCHNNTAN